MAKVLIVDDERAYRDYLQASLSREGHEVETASSSREGIEKGLQFRPRVLVTEWMLRDHLHGLHVAEALHLVFPDLNTILMTGFPSRDLRQEAKVAGIFHLLEKPFSLREIQPLVHQAARSPSSRPARSDLSLLRVQSEGHIEDDGPTSHLDDLFLSPPDLDRAQRKWIPVKPREDPATTWFLRSSPRRPDGGRHVAIASGRCPEESGSPPALHGLLSLDRPPSRRGAPNGRVLVIERSALHRQLLASLLEIEGVGCYAVEDLDDALRLFRRDPEIRTLILDRDSVGDRLEEVVRAARSLRPDVTLVSTGRDEGRDDLSRLGVQHAVRKPWRVSDLLEVFGNGAGATRSGICNDPT